MGFNIYAGSIYCGFVTIYEAEHRFYRVGQDIMKPEITNGVNPRVANYKRLSFVRYA